LKLKDRPFYGWVVVATFLVIGTTIWGIRFSFGVFFKSIEGEFNLTRAATSGIFSAYMVLGGVFTILGGWALDRYGPRIIIFVMGIFTGLSLLLTSQTNLLWHLFVTYSLLLAVGTGSLYVVIMSTVSRWFDKKRGLALGIASSGNGLGTLVVAPFATFLIAKFDWYRTYLILGLIAWGIVLPLSRLLRRDPYEIGTLPDGAKAAPPDKDLPQPRAEENNLQPTDLSLRQALRTRSFWLIIFSWLLYASSLFLVLTHLVPHVTDIGFSAAEGATVLSLVGGTSIVGRVLLGTISDRIGRKATGIICALVQAGAIVWLAWSQQLWMLYLFALIYGLAYGGMTPSMAALISDTFGLRKIGAILGVLDVGFGLGAAIGPVVGGLIFDVSKSYFTAFLLGVVAMVVVTLFVTQIRQETNRKS
jgi:MFS family permease